MDHFVIPDIYCPFPSLISPRLEQAQQHTLQWVRDFRLIQQEIAWQYYFKADFVQFACRAYPLAELEAIFLICDWCTWGFIFDDQSDNREFGRRPESMPITHNHLVSLLHDPPLTAPQGPIAEAILDIWQRVQRLTSPVWRRRFAQHHADFYAAQRLEAEHRARKYVPDMQTYIDNRLDAAGAPIVIDLLEIEGAIEIPVVIYESQLFQDIIEIGQHIMCWTNDVYSLRKELAHGEVNNLVVTVQDVQKCSLQGAVNEVCAMIEVQTRRLEAMFQKLPSLPDSLDCSLPASIDCDLRTYEQLLGSCIRGNLEWSRRTDRYIGMEYLKPRKLGSYIEEIMPFCSTLPQEKRRTRLDPCENRQGGDESFGDKRKEMNEHTG